MATGIPARLTPAEGRKFGLTVGGAFLLITAVMVWRGRLEIAPYVTGTIGGLLVLAGLVAPTALGPVNRAWMGLSHLLSKVTSPVFMGIVYFVVLAPIGLVMRLMGRNPLVHASGGDSYWFGRDSAKPDPARMERQF